MFDLVLDRFAEATNLLLVELRRIAAALEKLAGTDAR